MFDNAQDRIARLNIDWFQRRVDKLKVQHERLKTVTKITISELEHHRFLLKAFIAGSVILLFLAAMLASSLFIFYQIGKGLLVTPMLEAALMLCFFILFYTLCKSHFSPAMDFFLAASPIERGKRQQHIDTLKAELQARMVAQMERQAGRAEP